MALLADWLGAAMNVHVWHEHFLLIDYQQKNMNDIFIGIYVLILLFSVSWLRQVSPYPPKSV